jgi:hypothetical protein
MQLPMHVEEPHPDMPAVTIGKLGGPLLELVDLVAGTMKETGEILKAQGYRDLGHFVIEALNEAKKVGAAKGLPPSAEVIVQRVRCPFLTPVSMGQR